MQILALVTAPDSDCFDDGVNTDFNLCTSNAQGEGFCTSDLGGPLVSNSQLIGIANSNVPCALGVMDAYTRISFYRFWIASIAGA